MGRFLLCPQIGFLAPLIALAYRAPRGTNCVCAARDYSLLALSIGQFVLLRPQIGFLAPLSNARFAPPARLQLRRSYVRPMAARIVYRSICVTSPTNCPIGLRPKFGCARHNASKLAFCSRLHEFSPRVVRGALITSPRGCPTHHAGCCRAGPWCLQLSHTSVQNHPS